MTGTHIELFLVDGVPGGITTARVAGWTGNVLLGPRSQLAEILKRPETQGNGTYMLLGDDHTAVGNTRCYIGKTEDFNHRFHQHNMNKDFWDRLVVMTSSDDSFNEGHWGYLEYRLVQLATDAARVSLTNTQVPQPRKLSEAQICDMESYIDQLQVVLPVLGVNALRRLAATSPTSSTQTLPPSPTFTLTVARTGIDARAQVDGDEFVMLAGSLVVPAWTNSGRSDSTRRSYASYRAQFDALVADGSIIVEEDHGRLTRDVPFASPSTAGAIATGRSCNGREAWRWDQGTYADWENRGL